MNMSRENGGIREQFCLPELVARQVTPGEAKADSQRAVESEAPALWLDLWAEEGQRALKEQSGEGEVQAIESLQSQERAKTVWDGRVSLLFPEAA